MEINHQIQMTNQKNSNLSNIQNLQKDLQNLKEIHDDMEELKEHVINLEKTNVDLRNRHKIDENDFEYLKQKNVELKNKISVLRFKLGYANRKNITGSQASEPKTFTTEQNDIIDKLDKLDGDIDKLNEIIMKRTKDLKEKEISLKIILERNKEMEEKLKNYENKKEEDNDVYLENTKLKEKNEDLMKHVEALEDELRNLKFRIEVKETENEAIQKSAYHEMGRRDEKLKELNVTLGVENNIPEDEEKEQPPNTEVVLKRMVSKLKKLIKEEKKSRGKNLEKIQDQKEQILRLFAKAVKNSVPKDEKITKKNPFLKLLKTTIKKEIGDKAAKNQEENKEEEVDEMLHSAILTETEYQNKNEDQANKKEKIKKNKIVIELLSQAMKTEVIQEAPENEEEDEPQNQKAVEILADIIQESIVAAKKTPLENDEKIDEIVANIDAKTLKVVVESIKEDEFGKNKEDQQMKKLLKILATAIKLVDKRQEGKIHQITTLL